MLTSREKVIPWGIPQIEDRALDTAQREWGAYQGRLEETQTQLSSTLTRLKQVGQRFLSLAQWLEEMEKVAKIRRHRRSDRAIKETQLKKLQVRERDKAFVMKYKICALNFLWKCQWFQAQKEDSTIYY